MMLDESDKLIFRVMGFGTYGTHVKAVATLAIIFGGLFAAVGVTQMFRAENMFVAIAFFIFGLIDLVVGLRMWLVGVGIEKVQEYRAVHHGSHPKDTLYMYTPKSQTLTKTKNETSEVLAQGSAPTFSVRKTSSRGGFAGFLFTLNWPGSSAVVMLGQDEEEKREIEQALLTRGIQGQV